MSIVIENQYRDLLSRPEQVAKILSDSDRLTHDQFVIRYAELFRDAREQASDRARNAAEELLDHAETVKIWVDDHLSRWCARASKQTERTMRPRYAKSPGSRPGVTATIPTIVAVSLFFAERERRLCAGYLSDGHQESVERPYQGHRSADTSPGVARAYG